MATDFPGIDITDPTIPDIPDIPEIDPSKLLNRESITEIFSRAGVDISGMSIPKLDKLDIDISQFGLDPAAMDLKDLTLLNVQGLNVEKILTDAGATVPGLNTAGGLFDKLKPPAEIIEAASVPSQGLISQTQAAQAAASELASVDGTLRGRWTITDEVGNVRLGDTDLPGIFVSMSITQAVEMETVQVKGRSGRAKQLVGYGDANVRIEMMLDSDDNETCFDKLARLQSVFRKTDSAAKPDIMTLINVHCQARGIEKVIFKSLVTSERTSDSLSASIELEEYVPFVPVIRESRAARPGTGGYGGSDLDDWLQQIEKAKAGVKTPELPTLEGLYKKSDAQRAAIEAKREEGRRAWDALPADNWMKKAYTREYFAMNYAKLAGASPASGAASSPPAPKK